MKSWLGRCHLYQGEGADRVDYEALVAVFCAEIEAFDLAVRAHLDGKDMRLLWSEERHPAGEWLARNPAEKHAADLARSVHERHPVKIGTLTQSGAAVDSEAQSYLTIEEHKITPLPDQTGIPFWDKEWIAPELKELLFGQPKTGETLRTYFIVDVILRKKITKLFDLDTVDVPVKCLFKGDAAVELKEAAPYLIDMTLLDGAWDDKDLVPNFHKDFFDKHWGANTGIFIRSTADMDAIWNHFRKFTRVQVEEDKRWVFFRFWDPRIAPNYFDSIKDISEKAAQWVDIRGTGRIENIIGNQTDSANAWSMIPTWEKLEGLEITGTPMLSDYEMQKLSKYTSGKFIKELNQLFLQRHTQISIWITPEKGLKASAYIKHSGNSIKLSQRGQLRAWGDMLICLGHEFYNDPLYSFHYSTNKMLYEEGNFQLLYKEYEKFCDKSGYFSFDIKIHAAQKLLKISESEGISTRISQELFQKCFEKKINAIDKNEINHFHQLCRDDFIKAEWVSDTNDFSIFTGLSFIFGRKFHEHPYLPSIPHGKSFDYRKWIETLTRTKIDKTTA